MEKLVFIRGFFVSVFVILLSACGGAETPLQAGPRNEAISSPDCVFVYGPTRIDKPGHYCLASDFSSNDIGIEITSDDVTLDLQSKTIYGPDVSSGLSLGIHILGRRVSVSNGSITGFFMGVKVGVGEDDLEDPNGKATGVRLEKLSIFKSGFRGIFAYSNEFVAKENRIFSTGGTKAFAHAFAMGIEVKGRSCEIVGNSILDTMPMGNGEGVGISISYLGEGCRVEHNIVSNLEIPRYGRTIGIWMGGYESLGVVTRNLVSNFVYPAMGRGVVFARGNTFVGSGCGIANAPLFYFRTPYDTLSKQNQFSDPAPECGEFPDRYLRRAENGDVLAQFALYRIYRDGALVERDWDLADNWLAKAARGGHAEAQRVADIRGIPY